MRPILLLEDEKVSFPIQTGFLLTTLYDLNVKEDIPSEKRVESDILSTSKELVAQSIVEVANESMNHPVPKIITPLGISSIAKFMTNKDEENS